jgi:hypothetical protein
MRITLNASRSVHFILNLPIHLYGKRLTSFLPFFMLESRLLQARYHGQEVPAAKNRDYDQRSRIALRLRMIWTA